MYQRAIVGRRLAMTDSEVLTKYTLPFVDADWNVPFVVLDLLGSPPRVLRGPIRLDGSGLRAKESRTVLRPIESIPVDRFATLVHFDPWWAFRGMSGVDRTWIEAVFTTNIARPFMHQQKKLKIHDLRFVDGMERLDVVLAKDELFHTIEFHVGDIDLSHLRGNPPPTQVERTVSSGAKVL
jgi:hypothetical protein